MNRYVVSLTDINGHNIFTFIDARDDTDFRLKVIMMYPDYFCEILNRIFIR